MKQVFCQIPMGNGHPGSTEALVLDLYKRLSNALVALSGEQQNGGMGFPYNEKAGREAKEVIEDAVRDIAMGLTGLQIRFRRGERKTKQ